MMKINALLFFFALISFTVSCNTENETAYTFPSYADSSENEGNEGNEGDNEGDNEGGDEDDGIEYGGELQEGYPASISLYSFTDEFTDGNKCVGWYAVVDLSSEDSPVFNTVYYSNFMDPEEIFSDFQNEGKTPYIVTNAGYFYGSSSLSLCIHQGTLESIATQTVTRSSSTVYPVRAAFGQFEDKSFEATWVYCLNRVAYSYSSPLDNDERTGEYMSSPPSSSDGVSWSPYEAIGGGPMLVYDGENVAVECYWREVFDGGGILGTSRQPRTAIGATASGKLLLLVCDGRSMNDSSGYTLEELADKMISLGAVYAINLDGGGSSAIVGKDGTVLNSPSDGSMRKVPTAIVISSQ